MRNVIVIVPEKKVRVTPTDYQQMKDRIIDNVVSLVKKEHKKDKPFIDAVIGLCRFMNEAKFNKTSAELVRGLYGFLNWAQMAKCGNQSIISNMVHDLYAFKKDGKKAWFAPRTHRYHQWL
jgi:hypothetical protein